MNDLEAAIVEVTSILAELNLPYMLIGGLAVSLSGAPRLTVDVDVSVWAQNVGQTGSAIASRLTPRREAVGQMIERTRLLLVTASNGVPVDIVFAVLPYEQDAMRRARTVRIHDREIRVASPEDLILMKLISERSKDRDDAVRLIRRFRKTLDRGYLEPLLDQLADALAMPDILTTYRAEIDR